MNVLNLKVFEVVFKKDKVFASSKNDVLDQNLLVNL